MKSYQNFDLLYLSYEEKLKAYVAEMEQLNSGYDELVEKMNKSSFEVNENSELKKKASEENLERTLQTLDLESKRMNAELNRYKIILEEGSSKYAFMTPEMDETINRMKEAVNAFIDSRIKEAKYTHEHICKEINEAQLNIFSSNDKECSIARDKIKDFVENKNSTVVEKELQELNS
jgi:hypothetical protein